MAPLQNRVDPYGDLHAVDDRGAWTGNRGILHNGAREVVRRHQTRRWIVCTLDGPRRTVMSPNRWTELFFLDEATAFAAGHRPCFFCRRRDAELFARLWTGDADRARADGMDRVLDAQRHARKPEVNGIGKLAAGVMLDIDGEPYVTTAAGMRRWSFAGYGQTVARPSRALVITPSATVQVLAAGYPVQVHRTAGA